MSITFDNRKRKLWFVCDLVDCYQLKCKPDGTPYVYNIDTNQSAKVLPEREPDFVEAIEQWQRDLSNDCLRARGDVRWIAASRAAMKLKA